MNKTEQHKKAILEALESSLGVVTSACKKVGIGRTIFYEWLKTDEDFSKAVKWVVNYNKMHVSKGLYAITDTVSRKEAMLIHESMKIGVDTKTTKEKMRGYT